MADLDAVLRTERLALLGLLETLSEAQWETPSLCSAWTVGDVAAHLASASTTPWRSLVPAMVRGRFRVNDVNEQLTREMAVRGRDAVLDELRRIAHEGLRPPGLPIAAALVDATVHQLDIARPVGRERPIPPAAFEPAADFSLKIRWPVTVAVGGDARRRVRDVRLVAVGTDWVSGTGPDVHASPNALLLVLSGRQVAEGELRGSGSALLLSRL